MQDSYVLIQLSPDAEWLPAKVVRKASNGKWLLEMAHERIYWEYEEQCLKILELWKPNIDDSILILCDDNQWYTAVVLEDLHKQIGDGALRVNDWEF